MAVSNKDRQRAFRQSRTKARDALGKIILRLEGNEKPLAVELRAIAEEGLK